LPPINLWYMAIPRAIAITNTVDMDVTTNVKARSPRNRESCSTSL